MLAMISAPNVASAQTPSTSGTCTTFAEKLQSVDPANPNTQEGILTNITGFIKTVINEASKKLFTAFTNSPSYRMAVNAAATLMIVFYGVAFTIGVVQFTAGELLKRLVRLGIIFTIISPTGWDFFNTYVVKFFNDGTDNIIGEVMGIGMGTPYVPGTSPFLALDGIAAFMLSPDMIVAMLGAVGDNKAYGVAMGAMLAFAIMGLIKLILKGLQLYAISFIVRALLLGVAPIFLVFILFDKTRPLFTGWLNTLVNMSLTPILYFTFISFFLTMIIGAAGSMMGGNELCWTQAKIANGSAQPQAFWKFMDKNEKFPSLAEKGWKGPVDCVLGGGQCPEFPINIIDILTFIILVYVATQFAEVVDNIAREISNSQVNLDQSARMDFGKSGEGGQSLIANKGVPKRGG